MCEDLDGDFEVKYDLSEGDSFKLEVLEVKSDQQSSYLMRHLILATIKMNTGNTQLNRRSTHFPNSG